MTNVGEQARAVCSPVVDGECRKADSEGDRAS